MERQDLDGERPVIALLPGSRRGEIRNNLPLMIEAAKRFPDFQYAVAAAPAVPEKFYREIAQDPGLQVVFGATPTLLKYSQAAVVTSGTATLETALIGTPQVVCYRGNGRKLTYSIMEKLLKVKYVSLPNLIVGNSVVPELLLHLCTPDAVAPGTVAASSAVAAQRMAGERIQEYAVAGSATVSRATMPLN